MPEVSEWVSTAEAVRLLLPTCRNTLVTHRTIFGRLEAGIIRARASVAQWYVEGQERQEIRDSEIPPTFWRDRAIFFSENWAAGDFENLFKGGVLKAYGVQLNRDDLLPLITVAAPDTQSTATSHKFHPRKIFIVHGREDGPREAVARFLEKLDFKVVILNEKASRSRTVIEKLEANADVGFAVVLLTPDDTGSLKSEPQQSRARQNVILELGYFIGKLGRDRVCALKKGEVEIPSDWRGVVSETYDDLSPVWKMVLARELKEAGYDINMALAL